MKLFRHHLFRTNTSRFHNLRHAS